MFLSYSWHSQIRTSATSSKCGVLKFSMEMRRGYPRTVRISLKLRNSRYDILTAGGREELRGERGLAARGVAPLEHGRALHELNARARTRALSACGQRRLRSRTHHATAATVDRLRSQAGRASTPRRRANDFFGTSGLTPPRERVVRRPRRRPAGARTHDHERGRIGWRAGGSKDTTVDEPHRRKIAGRPAGVRGRGALYDARAAEARCPRGRLLHAHRRQRRRARAVGQARASGGMRARRRARARRCRRRSRRAATPSAPLRPRRRRRVVVDVEPTLLDLSMRELRAVPPSVTSHHSLLELNLSFNSLTSIDALPRACPLLQRLSVAHNPLAALPSLASLTSLRRLDVSSNRLRRRRRRLPGARRAPRRLQLPAAGRDGAAAADGLPPPPRPAQQPRREGAARRDLPPHAALLLRQLATLDASPLDVAAARAFAKADDARRALSDTLGHKIALVALKADAPMEAASRRREAVPRRRRGGGAGPPADASAGRWRHKDDPRPAACASFDAPPGYDDLSVRMGGANGGGLQPSLGVVATIVDERPRSVGGGVGGGGDGGRLALQGVARVELSSQVAVGAGDDAAPQREVPW